MSTLISDETQQLAEIDKEIDALNKEYDDCDCQYECTACFGNMDDIKTLKRQREYLVMDSVLQDEEIMVAL